MMNLINNLFGVTLNSVVHPAVWLGCALLAVAGTIYAYRYLGERLSRGRQVVLISLRGWFLLLVLALLLRPTLVLTRQSQVRQPVLLLRDASASMSFRTNALTGEMLLVEFDRDKPYTAIGDAVRAALQREPLAGIVLVTDGANNAGSSPREAAVLAGQKGVPLFIYGPGIANPPDLAVTGLSAPERVFVDETVPVTVRVRATGLTAKLELRLDDKLVAEQTITGDGDQLVSLKFTPPAKGLFNLEARIAPLANEVTAVNNQRSLPVRVLDEKIKVLLVEQSPRWEWRHLQATLRRDRRLQLQCVLLDGDPAIATGVDSPYLKEFPRTKSELFGYDLIILGDVDPLRFRPGQLDDLGRFVSEFGGSLLLIAGQRFNPHAYRRTVIEQLLPVEIEPNPSPVNAPIRLELTATGKTNPRLSLANTPPLGWVSHVGRAKPAAEVLIVTSNQMPVVAGQQYGVGRVQFVGTDNTWRWRKDNDAAYVAFWGQMAQPKLLGDAKRNQLHLDRQIYAPGDRVTVFGRLYNDNYEPLTVPELRGFSAGRESSVVLRQVPGRPGEYRGEFAAPAIGNYPFHLERAPQTGLDFRVQVPQFEMADTALNEPLLREMAQLSGGAYLRDADLNQLPDLLGRKAETVTTTQEIPCWSSPVAFVLLLLLVTGEWILRKRWQLP